MLARFACLNSARDVSNTIAILFLFLQATRYLLVSYLGRLQLGSHNVLIKCYVIVTCSCVSLVEKVASLPLITTISVFISARFLTQLKAIACRNSGILSAYITGFIKALEQLRAKVITNHLVTETLSFTRVDEISRGIQQSKVTKEANIKVFVKRTFCSSLFFCCDVMFPCWNFLQTAMLLPQMRLIAETLYNEPTYLIKLWYGRK